MQSARASNSAMLDRITLAAIAFIPFIYAISSWDHEASRELTGMRQFGYWALVVALLAVIVSIVRSPSLRDAVDDLPMVAKIGLAATIAIALISAARAEFTPAFAMMKTLVNILILLFGLSLLAILSRLPVALRHDFATRILLAGFAAYLALVIAFIATAPDDFNWVFFGLTAQNIRNLGSHMMTLAAFSIGLSFVAHGRWRWAAIVVAVVSVAVLAWSGSRGSALVLLATALLGIALAGRERMPRNIVASLFIFGLGGALSLVHQVDDVHFGLWRILGISDRLAAGESLTTGRWELWLATIELYRGMPIFGYGDGQFIRYYDGPLPLAFPHNVVLQLWFQWGWIGGSIAILLLGWLAAEAFKRTLKSPEDCLPAFMMLACIGLYGLIDGPFYDTLPMLFFAIAAALCFAPMAKSGQPKKA